MSRIRWIVIYIFHDINSCAFLANHYSRKHCHTVCKQFILVMIGTLVYFQRAIILDRLFTQFANDMSHTSSGGERWEWCWRRRGGAKCSSMCAGCGTSQRCLGSRGCSKRLFIFITQAFRIMKLSSTQGVWWVWSKAEKKFIGTIFWFYHTWYIHGGSCSTQPLLCSWSINWCPDWYDLTWCIWADIFSNA